MTPPTAIYRPRTRSLLLASGDGSLTLPADRAPRLVTALRRVSSMLRVGGTLAIRNATGRLSLYGDQLHQLADAIDVACAMPATIAGLLASRS